MRETWTMKERHSWLPWLFGIMSTHLYDQRWSDDGIRTCASILCHFRTAVWNLFANDEWDKISIIHCKPPVVGYFEGWVKHKLSWTPWTLGWLVSSVILHHESTHLNGQRWSDDGNRITAASICYSSRVQCIILSLLLTISVVVTLLIIIDIVILRKFEKQTILV